jgi:dipeptidyl-peptidase-3
MNPIGINIPNYDEIRLNAGFKNVSLSNGMNAFSPTPQKLTFMQEEAIPDFIRLSGTTQILHVALHELYGHGSGKLLKAEDVVGKNIPDLLSPGKIVETYWAEGETFQTVFGGWGPAFEECRAETTALHLACKPEIQEMYGVPPEDRFKFKVVATLGMVHAAIKTLMYYNPDAGKWTQAHSRARFAILRAVLQWGDGALEVKKIGDRFRLVLDESKFDRVEYAIEQLLKHLNYYKGARLADQGNQFFTEITSLDAFWLEVRQQAIALKLPRGITIGAVIQKTADGYTLARCGGEKINVLDASLSIVESIKLALE